MESAPSQGGAEPASEAARATQGTSRQAEAASSTSTSDRVAATTRETVRTLKMSSVGIELALSVLIGLFAGRWLDGKLGTSPWLMIVLLCLGFAAGLRSVVRTMDRASRASDEPPREAGAAGDPPGDKSADQPDDSSGPRSAA